MVTRKRNSALTEEQILESALKLFSEQGFAGTPTSQIAAEAKISEGTLFKYFPKKIDLLRRCLYHFVERYGAELVLSPLEKIFETHKDQGPKVLLKAIIMDRINLLDKMGPIFKVLLIEMQYHQELKVIFTERIMTEVKEFGDKLFTYFHETGYIREFPSFVPIRSFIGMAGLMILQRKFIPELNSDCISLEEEIDCILDIFLRGVLNEEGKHETYQ